MLNKYYVLTKPGIIYGNSIAVIGGFFLASKGRLDLKLLIATLVGAGLVMASGCVFNNYIDRGIDKKMERTKNRAIVNGLVSGRSAIIFATILGTIGLATLWFFTNVLTTLIGVTGLFFYVIVYGYAKRTTIYGTLVGSISGALPPVAGYTAVSSRLDIGAVLLFIVLACWQMPHFYAIAIYRLKEYKSAGLPVLPAIKGIARTKKEMLFYIATFILATIALFIFGQTGYMYLVIMELIGLYWLFLAIKGLSTRDNNKWARQLFGFSLIVLITFCMMITLNAWIY